jgi:hypothetical protein
MRYVFDDGGRAAAGFRGEAPGDCVVRAIAIAIDLPYRDVYTGLYSITRGYAEQHKNSLARLIGFRGATPRNGVPTEIIHLYGYTAGTGCQRRARGRGCRG